MRNLHLERECVLGCTDSFLQRRLTEVRCNPATEIFDACLDAPEYLPTGSTIDFKGYRLTATVQVRF